jgi:hypothetical protein
MRGVSTTGRCPAVRDLATGSMADWQQLVRDEHGGLLDTEWVFASTQRVGIDGDAKDISIYPNSLNRHIARMRADGALAGMPYFSLHLVRSAQGDYIASARPDSSKAERKGA